jgi:hypothetical protein
VREEAFPALFEALMHTLIINYALNSLCGPTMLTELILYLRGATGGRKSYTTNSCIGQFPTF